ncbi:histidine phosphatase family protein [Moritella sp. Urea-trap-13]|uniref:histidine phosphatase family protein n=1 Tax=Moritella sp. Urea-trap-13 TaxID=2058327 RepID=UPI000C3456FE|nr:histidine phosphatase family protein [Moritella sp. Urea-trap-13]PKH07996.1 histidine phosphatase family protein [Moritella sp. Urea-trap-13]
MINVYFIRHGQTQWNCEKRLQGRTDIPLNDAGRQQICAYQLPSGLSSLQWFHSPLLRAQQTAQLLGVDSQSETALIEMSWGEWEGKTLAQLRAQDPINVAKQEALGLDLRPAGGESPRLVAERVSDWLGSLDNDNTVKHMGCVSHKGIIRAIYACATDWNMLAKPLHKIDFYCAQHFCFEQGRWSIGELNIPL